MPPNDQILMGIAITLLSLLGIVKTNWLLTNTSKGKRLVQRFGQQKAVFVLRIFLAIGMLFGSLLAYGVINPIQWE